MRTTDIAVIGAGVAGASIAFHLAKVGAGKITVFERDFPASGASGRSGALVRMHYPDPHQTRLAFESFKIFTGWADLVGGDCGFRKTGFLWIMSPENADKLRRNVEMHRAIGVNARVVGPAEIKELQPFAEVDDIGAAAYEPDSGYADPSDTTNGFLRAAKALGVEVLQSSRVTSLVREGGRVTGLVCNGEPWSAGTTIVAAGAWSGPLCATAAIDLPLRPMRIGAGMIFRPPEVKSHVAYIDTVVGNYWRTDVGDHTLIGLDGEEPVYDVDPDDFPQSIQPATFVKEAAAVARRIPAFEKVTLGRAWAGVDGTSPDRHAIIGPVPGVEGIFVQVAGSGKGFKVAPAIGKALAELITTGDSATADLRPFRLSRFAENEPLTSESEYMGDFLETGSHAAGAGPGTAPRG